MSHKEEKLLRRKWLKWSTKRLCSLQGSSNNIRPQDMCIIEASNKVPPHRTKAPSPGDVCAVPPLWTGAFQRDRAECSYSGSVCVAYLLPFCRQMQAAVAPWRDARGRQKHSVPQEASTGAIYSVTGSRTRLSQVCPWLLREVTWQ